MAIGNADFTNKEKNGLAWFFNCENNWDAIEPLLIVFIKQAAEGWRLQKNEQATSFKEDIGAIVADLKDDPTQIPAVKTVLGL
jgi:hypothetical protein